MEEGYGLSATKKMQCWRLPVFDLNDLLLLANKNRIPFYEGKVLQLNVPHDIKMFDPSRLYLITRPSFPPS